MRAIARRVLRETGPAVARPGSQKARPMRLSLPMPWATSSMLPPTFSQISAISLIKLTLVARNVLAAYSMSSAETRSVRMSSTPPVGERPVEFFQKLVATSFSVPITIRSASGSRRSHCLPAETRDLRRRRNRRPGMAWEMIPLSGSPCRPDGRLGHDHRVLVQRRVDLLAAAK